LTSWGGSALEIEIDTSMASHDDAPVIRPATPDDMEACHDVMWMSVTDFGRRNGTPLEGTAADWWASDPRLQRSLATRAAEWWVAEEAGAIERDGLFELTEFFVLPTKQSRGIGKALIERAFPTGRDRSSQRLTVGRFAVTTPPGPLPAFRS
jgi:GNAT superfamily N-acetyltransferase